MALFILVLHLALIATGLGWPVDMAKVIGVAIGILLVIMGNFLSRIKPNWFMGIRTPWTLESDSVWRKTHRVGGRLFVAAGLVVIAVTLIGRQVGLILMMVTIMLAAIGSVIASYYYWKQEAPEKSS